MTSPARIGVLCLGLLGPLQARANEPLALPFELAATLPDGWRLAEPLPAEPRREILNRIQLVCETPACKRTQETCTILLRHKELVGNTDEARLRQMYRSPIDRYARMRAVLKHTSRDATLIAALAEQTIGDRPWYVVETDAAYGYKSGLFAETVIEGRYVGVICKTCETGEVRHQAGRKLMESLRPID